MELSPLVEALRDASLIAFLGAGVSRTYQDSLTQRIYPGLPPASDIINILSERRDYISNSFSFPEACFLYKQRESRGQLEKFLLEIMDRPVIKPLPAHVIIANLPFSAFVTTNYDQLLERALKEAKLSPHIIITDEDVSRLRPRHIPVIKIHGCVSRPESMIAAEDEYSPLSESKPIIEATLKVLLSNKTILFLGFYLNDFDFNLVYNLVKRCLGDRMPRSYAVVHQAEEYRKIYWEEQGVNIIESDLTEFLRSLLRATTENSFPTVYYPGEDWINNSFFTSLHSIKSLPSETQVIDAFLKHLLEEMNSPGLRLEDIISRARRAVSLVLNQRHNFEALRRVVDALILEIEKDCNNNDEAALLVQNLIIERQSVGSTIGRKGAGLIQRGDSILIFSQSMRVAQLLAGVPAGVQDTCHVYVAECRPKSPRPFQDAIAFCEALKSSGYEFTLVPDTAIANLIQRQQIQKIFLGAHAIFSTQDNYHSFVNTCGTSMISIIAQKYGIPVYIVGESLKVRELNETECMQEVSFEEEENVFSSINSEISDLKATGQHIETLNIGYDLCPIFNNMSVILESSGRDSE